MKKLVFFTVLLSFALFSCSDGKGGKKANIASEKCNHDKELGDFNPSKKNGYIVEKFCKPSKRYCQTLELKDDPELIEEYKYWHKNENIWKEIPEGIKKVGILDMEIYLHGTRLFMIVETKQDFDWDKDMARLGQLEKQAEWEEFVSKFQKSKPGASSSEKWQLMEKIFELK